MISVLLGNGDGTFQGQVEYSPGFEAGYVQVGDFNRDGKLDIAVSSWQGNMVSILLGNGDGTFKPPMIYSSGACDGPLAVGDLNHDGKLDLAIAGGEICVMLGNGDGTLQGSIAYSAGGSPDSVVIGDFNNDGNQDLAVADGSGAAASVLLGNGDGTFQPFASFGVGMQPGWIAAGDFNNDGATDLTTPNFTPSTVSILLNNSGTKVTLTSAPNPSTKDQPVTFTATVTGSLEGQPLPTGTVSFEMGSGRRSVALVNGVATYTTSKLPAGTDKVTARYLGDENFIANSSQQILQVVNQ